MKKFNASLVAAFAILAINASNQAQAADQSFAPIDECHLVKPVVDTPLRAPSICTGPDGTYYLTGNASIPKPDGTPDFDNCGVIRLWKSADLKTWTDLGVVFDPMKVPWTPTTGHRMNWMKAPRGLAGVADSLRHYLGVTAARIHYLKGTFWIACSIHGESTVLIKSTSGKAEGPYEPMGTKGICNYNITRVGNDPSLFQDDDGSVYWLWSPSWIAKMKDDMTGLAEVPRMLTCAPSKELKGDVLVGSRGPFLWKANGLYHLAVSDVINRNGIRTEDTMVATSKELFGIYSKRLVMIPQGGQTTVFQDDKGNYRATVSAVPVK
jgi:beta-xylosidase